MDWDKIDSGLKQQTTHLLEGVISFKGTEKIPVSLLFSMNIWGNDARKYKDVDGDLLPEDAIVMSKYVELGYSKEFKNVNVNFFTGVALDDPQRSDAVGFYGQKLVGIVNLGIKLDKNIKIIEEYSLPVNATFVVNPSSENVFIVFGITI